MTSTFKKFGRRPAAQNTGSIDLESTQNETPKESVLSYPVIYASSKPLDSVATTSETSKNGNYSEGKKTMGKQFHSSDKNGREKFLAEWNPTHFQLFCGNLSREVTDDMLHRAFAKYPSLSKAKVLRDSKTGKSKEYGFVAFGDPDDYLAAFREMNNKYVGNHPIQLKKATNSITSLMKRKSKHKSGRIRK